LSADSPQGNIRSECTDPVRGCPCWLEQQCFKTFAHFALADKPPVAPVFGQATCRYGF
tara:strand:+ start:253 stop:426 length:174 start_codon:yes stop_codon:yes gene_type:complete